VGCVDVVQQACAATGMPRLRAVVRPWWTWPRTAAPAVTRRRASQAGVPVGIGVTSRQLATWRLDRPLKRVTGWSYLIWP
jgi:hypothetical protein